MKAQKGILTNLTIMILILISCSYIGCKKEETPIDKSVTTITISPDSTSVLVTQTVQFTTTAYFNDGTNSLVTNQTQWKCSESGIGAIDGNGLLTAVKNGSTQVIGSYQSFTDTSFVRTTGLVAIYTLPESLILLTNESQQFTAFAILQNGDTTDVTNMVTWSTNSPAVGVIDTYGLFTAIGLGVSSIRAELAGKIDISVVEVKDISSIIIIPDSVALFKSEKYQFHAIAQYMPSGTEDITSYCGELTAFQGGTATIIASINGLSSSPSDVIVSEIVSIEIIPGDTSVYFGANLHFTAIAQLLSGGYEDITDIAQWNSTNEQYGIIDTAGYFTSLDFGYTFITAEKAGIISNVSKVTISGSAPVFMDNFENEIVGGYPSKWLYYIGSYSYNDIEITDFTSHSGQKSCLIKDNGSFSSNYCYIYQNFTYLESGNIRFSWRTENDGFGIRLYSNSWEWDDLGIYILFHEGQIVYGQEVGGYTNFYTLVPNYTSNAWYTMNLVFDCYTDTYDIYLNGTLIKANTPFYNKRSYVSKILCIAFDETQCKNAYVDDVIITGNTKKGVTYSNKELPAHVISNENGNFSTKRKH